MDADVIKKFSDGIEQAANCYLKVASRLNSDNMLYELSRFEKIRSESFETLVPKFQSILGALDTLHISVKEALSKTAAVFSVQINGKTHDVEYNCRSISVSAKNAIEYIIVSDSKLILWSQVKYEDLPWLWEVFRSLDDEIEAVFKTITKEQLKAAAIKKKSEKTLKTSREIAYLAEKLLKEGMPYDELKSLIDEVMVKLLHEQ